ncbi:MAG TPA: DUF2950 domain-containing protein [Caldimonas sp.]|nr:DUF2950 domain-containing protein [Caldimonas sp.]
MNRMPAIDKVAMTMTPRALMNLALRRVALLALLLTAPLLSQAAEQRTFPTPTAAVDSFIGALKANDDAALVALFGEKHKNVVISGDAAYDGARRAEILAALNTFHVLEDSSPERVQLLVGTRAWPFPIPLVREGGSWRFATERGAEEILNRRIGRNERSAIAVLRAYVAAQQEYASVDRNGDGVLQYAQKLASAPGKFDGLYWAADTSRGETASPLGPLIAESSPYLAGRKTGDPYRGYHFRILTGQGKNAPGGAYSYIINGRMVAGAAMVAYPAEYDATGVMTFIVNSAGKLYEKNLGKNTAAIASKMTTFDPGPGWKEVAP